ncbi:MAG: DUF4347 domain-containing protein, partial [Cyanobacteria bacterium J06627_8]
MTKYSTTLLHSNINDQSIHHQSIKDHQLRQLSSTPQYLATGSRAITTHIAIIDPSVEDYQLLLEGLHTYVTPYILDANQDGVQQITHILQDLQHQKSNIQHLELHIITHGSPGTLHLGNTTLSLSTLGHYAEALETWFNPTSDTQHPTSDSASCLNIYACNVAAGDAGDEFITKLHHLTGATIHASTTKIGNTALGGNWELDAIAPSSALHSLPSAFPLSLFS